MTRRPAHVAGSRSPRADEALRAHPGAAARAGPGRRGRRRRPGLVLSCSRRWPQHRAPAMHPDDARRCRARRASPRRARETGSAEFAYEVQYLLDAPADEAGRRRCGPRSPGSATRSLVVGTGDGTWNVHVHVNDVGAAIEAGIEAGRRTASSVVALRSISRRDRTPSAERTSAVVVAVAPGDGLATCSRPRASGRRRAASRPSSDVAGRDPRHRRRRGRPAAQRHRRSPASPRLAAGEAARAAACGSRSSHPLAGAGAGRGRRARRRPPLRRRRRRHGRGGRGHPLRRGHASPSDEALTAVGICQRRRRARPDRRRGRRDRARPAGRRVRRGRPAARRRRRADDRARRRRRARPGSASWSPRTSASARRSPRSPSTHGGQPDHPVIIGVE